MAGYTWGLMKAMASEGPPARQDLVPIPGTPPSLINPPSGCHFHPRCPYSQPEHTRVDPMLEPVPGDESHQVACLLGSEQRRALWAQLRSGETPAEAMEAVDLPQQPDMPEAAQEPQAPEAPL
jgi:peptide/nickel transport system ATP-binding protein